MFRTLIYPSSGACDNSVQLPEACDTDTTPTQPHRNSNTHRTKNNTTNVVIQQNGRKILMMDILMSETCWAHKKWNKIASDIKWVFYFSTIHYTTMLLLSTAVIILANLIWKKNKQIRGKSSFSRADSTQKKKTPHTSVLITNISNCINIHILRRRTAPLHAVPITIIT